MIWEFDRSRHLDGLACKRKRYMLYHWNGRGLQKKQKSLALEFGSAFHEAAEDFLGGKGVESAVVRALDYLKERFDSAGVDLDAEDIKLDLRPTMIQYSVKEQMAIAEGLVRGWWAKNGERFLNDFDVIEVEKEGRAGLGEGVWLMFRPDALVREKMSGDLYVISWKTASSFGVFTTRTIEHDMQSMSEVWGIGSQAKGFCIPEDTGEEVIEHPIKIEGNLYLFAIKGKRTQDDWLGFKTQDTPLAYMWMRPGPTEEDTEYAWKYGWTTEELNEKTGKYVATKLGKGYRKVLVADHYPGGVKAWIEALAAQEIAPRHINALDAAFPESLPIERRADEIESWKRQTLAEELRWRDNVAQAESVAESVAHGEMAPEEFDKLLDELFPQSTARCWDYYSRCAAWETCFVPTVKDDPLGSGLYQIRISNHPEKAGDDGD